MPSHRPSPVLTSVALVAVALVTGCAGDEALGPPQPLASPVFARAGTPQPTGAELFVVPVEITLPAGRCGLTTTVTGSGELRTVVHTAQLDGRTLAVGFNSVATGTATGADGTRYRFHYTNMRHRVDFTGAPPFEAHIVDSFTLIGQGRAPDVRAFFNQYFVVNADGTRTILRDVTVGDPAQCDPL
jgi:hypothetical protein